MVPSKTRKAQPINQNLNHSPILGHANKHGRAQSIYSLYKDDQSVLDGINNELKIRSEKEDQNNIFPEDKLIQSPDISKRIDILVHEIKELKQMKSAVELKLKEETMKVLSYQKEIIQLREQVNYYKLKEIKEGEGILKLENQSLKNNINFRMKENELLVKQNASLNNHIAQLQNYIKAYIDNKKKEAEQISQLHEYDEELTDKVLYKGNDVIKSTKMATGAHPAPVMSRHTLNSQGTTKGNKPKESNLFDETSNTDDLFNKGNNTVNSKMTEEESPSRKIKLRCHTAVNESISPPVSNRTSIGLTKVKDKPSQESVENLFNSPPRSNENFKRNTKDISPGKGIRNVHLIRNKPKIVDLVHMNKEGKDKD